MSRLQTCALTFLIVLIFELVIAAGMSSQHARGYKTHCENQNAKDEDCASDNVALVFLREIAEAFDTHNGTITAIASIAVAFFTGTLWWVTAGMVRIADEQRTDMLRSIKAAEGSTTAALAANEISQSSLIAAQRAWISIEKVRLHRPAGFEQDGVDFAIEVTIVNLGSTPALNTIIKPTVIKGSETWSDHSRDKMMMPDIEPSHNGVVLFPRTSYTQNHLPSYDGDGRSRYLGDVGKDKTSAFIKVTISYDVLGSTKRHVTFVKYMAFDIRLGKINPTLPIDITKAIMPFGSVIT